MQLRLEKDIKKIAAHIDDLKAVPFSSELSAGLKEQCSDMKVALSALEQWMLLERSCEEKRGYMAQLSEELKPALNTMKEACRRIKAACWRRQA